MAHDGKVFDAGLRNEQSVEGIAMVSGQLCLDIGLFDGYGE